MPPCSGGTNPLTRFLLVTLYCLVSEPWLEDRGSINTEDEPHLDQISTRGGSSIYTEDEPPLVDI